MRAWWRKDEVKVKAEVKAKVKAKVKAETWLPPAQPQPKP
jgi:hypothetical protein